MNDLSTVPTPREAIAVTAAAAPHVQEPAAERRAERAAARAGVDAAAVERLPFDLSALDEEGVLINVDAAGFGLLDRRLDWQALGLALPDRSDIAFRAPRCGLLPDRYRLPLMRAPSRAHAALHRYGYRFRLVETVLETTAFRWLPWRAFRAFEAEFRAAQADLEAARGAVLDRYPAVREEVVATFLEVAADSARRLQATGNPIPEGFQDAVVRGVVDAMPSPQDLRDRLVLRYRVGVFWLGSELAAERRRALDERQRADASEAEQRLERERRAARARAVQEGLWADQERVRRRLAAEEEERRREAETKERIRQLKLEAARERLQDTISPLEEGARHLHAAVRESATAIRDSLERHQALCGGAARRARELARWFRLMAWQSDAQLEALLAELEHLATRPVRRRKRDPQPIGAVLDDIIARCYADTRELAEPHRMAALEV
jgi:hypothetical protein